MAIKLLKFHYSSLFAQIKTEAFSQSKVLLISKFVSLEQLFHYQISYQ